MMFSESRPGASRPGPATAYAAPPERTAAATAAPINHRRISDLLTFSDAADPGDGSSLGHTCSVTDGPLIVQSDKSLLLEVDHPDALACRMAIAPFAELERSPEHIHTYRLTPLGLWNA